MQKGKSILENETHTIIWEFETQMDHQITTRRPYRVLINKKKKLSSSGFYRCSGPESENKRT